MSGITKIVATVACLAVLTVAGRGAERTLVFTAIDFPGATLTTAQGINAGGEIVGAYNDAGSPSRTHGFVLSGGHYQSIDFPGATRPPPQEIHRLQPAGAEALASAVAPSRLRLMKQQTTNATGRMLSIPQ